MSSLLDTHDKLEIGFYFLTGAVSIFSVLFKSTYNDLRERIDDLKKTNEKQWERIDDINESYWPRDKHEEFRKEINATLDKLLDNREAFRKEIYASMEKSIEQANKPLIAELARLSTKVDILMEKQFRQ